MLYVGCPMWAHRPWVGRHLPTDTRVGRELYAYSRAFNAVEGNTTFYASPAVSTVAKWCEQAHPDFRFVFKVPRHITHDRRLRGVDADLNAFCSLMAPLGERVGGFTLQLPASFGPTDLGALESVLRHASTAWRWSVEVRHSAFFEGESRVRLEQMLQRYGAERVLLDTGPLFAAPPTTDEGREEWDQKPKLPSLTEALTDQPIVRCVGNDDPDITAAGVARWAPIVAEWLDDGRSPTFFVHTPSNLDTPQFVRDFHAAVRALVPSVSALPSLPTPEPAPEQGSLF